MKKNGFIASSLLYGMLALFLVIMLSTLGIFANNKLSMDKLKSKAFEDIDQEVGSNDILMGGIKVPIVTEGNGLYADTEEPDRYIYKGTNDVNNYIYIKENETNVNGTNVKYRIYSIESDGTVKVIRDEAITSMNFDADDATRRKTGYCSSYNYCNAWAAMASFKNGDVTGEVKGLNGNSGDSSIKEYIDGTYAQMIDTSKIVSKTWNISGTTFDRDILEDTIADEKKSTWNGKIALLTASEYVRANTNTASCGTLTNLYSNYSTCKITNYLYKSSDWWLLSPHSGLRDRVLFAYSYSISHIGRYASNSSGVRPVFYLCKGLTYSGKGTSSEPYQISGGNCTS